jgi:inner membrane protein
VAVAACILVVAYIGGQAALRDHAADIGAAHARALGLSGARVRALPSPLSPFNWLVVVQEPARMHFAYLSLWRERPPPAPKEDAGFFERLGAPYRPVAHAQWQVRTLFGEAGDAQQALAEAAWRHAGFAFFRWFSEYPMLLRVEHAAGEDCAWFEDLRFTTPGRAGVPFRYGMCRDGAGAWQAYALRADGRRAAVH